MHGCVIDGTSYVDDDYGDVGMWGLWGCENVGMVASRATTVQVVVRMTISG